MGPHSPIGAVVGGAARVMFPMTSMSTSFVMSRSWNVKIGSIEVCSLFFAAHPFTIGEISSTT